jgi:hypothetical protein
MLVVAVCVGRVGELGCDIVCHTPKGKDVTGQTAAIFRRPTGVDDLGERAMVRT